MDNSDTLEDRVFGDVPRDAMTDTMQEKLEPSFTEKVISWIF